MKFRKNLESSTVSDRRNGHKFRRFVWSLIVKEFLALHLTCLSWLLVDFLD